MYSAICSVSAINDHSGCITGWTICQDGDWGNIYRATVLRRESWGGYFPHTRKMNNLITFRLFSFCNFCVKEALSSEYLERFFKMYTPGSRKMPRLLKCWKVRCEEWSPDRLTELLWLCHPAVPVLRRWRQQDTWACLPVHLGNQ